MQHIEKRVIELIAEKIADREDLFIVSVKMRPNKILEILLDGDNGVNIDDCAQVSRHVGFHLEEENVIDDAYRLEVSSPGIDANFVNIRQYQKNIGRTVQVKLNDNTKVEGTLLTVDEMKINVLQKIKEKGKKAQEVEKELPFDQIKATKVVISF
ncbi:MULTISPECIES: ribosome assembly cofactor RimP [Sphingobacterium]|jgi:ribosome maturation factor RimP|uniref:Ribosome assembly cofactor RimP n=3 Tax=Sphingobacterium TaxID=28453 RepID=A0ACD5C1J0_9SPHI|nr:MULTISPECIES: ribosome assembly cofactor RimP [Sphingobacterium]APU98259.1 ribosome assembly cofactor RimP [Sphingobacterium sp. B29]MDF2853089.1 ribosome assembly cofactor RimP [Sphingobacterium multivorum]QRQ62621.1 ribosome assembly cofactor RimP [Sphingobacterium multivorum]TWI18338.1 ribosome maturation factor RimP [Sphingobacterium siyangense]SPZ93024.1 Ribosome maturation factor RimP [Sphingobacterium multivorum]